jgi:hypothetical protein
VRHPLLLHPDSACEAVSAIAVEAARPARGRLSLRYKLTATEGLLVPPPARPERTDELWKATCLEAFLRAPGADAYLELNLSPSGQWAAYAFDSYRAGMRAAEIDTPQIDWRATPNGYELAAEISGLPPGPWQAALTAVTRETSGRTSYWALAHPAGRADFHAPDGFVLTLPEAE